MKRNIVLASIFLLVSFSFSACAPVTPGGQAPEFLNDIGKTLSELKNEHPEGEFVGWPLPSYSKMLYYV